MSTPPLDNDTNLFTFFSFGLSFYLDVVDSHLLLSLAGSVRCHTALTWHESRAAVLPPSSGAAWQEENVTSAAGSLLTSDSKHALWAPLINSWSST